MCQRALACASIRRSVHLAFVHGTVRLALARGDEPSDDDLKKKPATTDTSEVGKLLYKWYKEGTAAGEVLKAKYAPKQAEFDKRKADLAALQDQLRKGGATMSEDARSKLTREIDSTLSANYRGVPRYLSHFGVLDGRTW